MLVPKKTNQNVCAAFTAVTAVTVEFPEQTGELLHCTSLTPPVVKTAHAPVARLKSSRGCSRNCGVRESNSAALCFENTSVTIPNHESWLQLALMSTLL